MAVFAIALAAALGCSGCSSTSPGSGADPISVSGAAAGPVSSQPSIVLISMDTTRADALGPYGGPAGLTPAIDRLAASGWVFERTVTPTPVTLPAHTTLLTALWPISHGVLDNGLYRLPEGVNTLPAALREEGYSTAAVVSAAVLDRQYGLDRGFDRYDDRFAAGNGLTIAERPAEEVTKAALRIASTLERPFFLFVHYFDPHADYAPPAAFRGRGRGPYDGEIAYVDHSIDELLTGLRERGALASDDILSIVADHGESLGEHGEPTHGVFLYQSTLHVPWILSAPGRLPPGRRIESPTNLADVAPTLLALTGTAPLPDVDGRSMVEPPPPSAPTVPVPLVSEFGTNAYGFAPLRGIWNGRWKWIDAPRPELYDLDSDTSESNNLHELRPAVVEILHAQELAYRTRSGQEGAPTPGSGERSTAERVQRLAGLGYLSTTRRNLDRSEELPDPKDGIDTLREINAARAELSSGNPDVAVARLESVVNRTPNSVSALVLLGSAHLISGRPEEALPVLDRAAELVPEMADVHFNRGLAHFALGAPARAEAAWRETVKLAPRHLEATANLADLLRNAGKPDEARSVLQYARSAGLQAGVLDFLEAKLALGRSEYGIAERAFESALRSGELPSGAAEEAAGTLRRLRKKNARETAGSIPEPESN